MQDILLLITVIAFMAFGFLIMYNIDKFLAEDFKGFKEDEAVVHKDEIEDNALK